MFNFIRKYIEKEKESQYKKPKESPYEKEKLSINLEDNLIKIREICRGSSDITIQKMRISGINCALITCEGMYDLDSLSRLMLRPLTKLRIKDCTEERLFKYLNTNTMLSADQKIFYTFSELFDYAMSGFGILLFENKNCGIAFGIQGFPSRSIAEPSSEMNIRGSREGFVESVKVNMTMVRRRLKTPDLCFEMSKAGMKSKTNICIVYRKDMVSEELLYDVKSRLLSVKLDNVLESGYLQPFLENRKMSLFSGVGSTERPDTFCAKICEGRVGILVDGTPFALTVPKLFAENFQSFDDYSIKPFYTALIRFLKYTAFFISTMLPGLYVAIATFHPELVPEALLYNIAAAEENTPFPLFFEAFIIHLFYEVMREAGLRLPRAVGHTVSIIGALIVGDAAVTAGLIGAPMVMVVALTAISSFVLPTLYETTAFLRFMYILAGGFLGLFGISVLFCLVFINLCSVNNYGIPTTSPLSPLSIYSLRDIFIRKGWRYLGKEDLNISNIAGSDIKENIN